MLVTFPMKRRILNYRLTATHSLMTELPSFNDPVSISDYDAFVLDINAIAAEASNATIFTRRQNEVRELLHLKGGVIVAVLRPNDNLPGNLNQFDRYSLLQNAAPTLASLVRGSVRAGDGSRISIDAKARGALGGYFRIMRENLRFSAFLDTDEDSVAQVGGTVFAVNSVGKPVALEFIVGSAHVCFIPVSHDVPADRVGAAIARVIEAHFGGPAEVAEPVWAKEVSVPGADVHDGRIAGLENERSRIDEEIAGLTARRTGLLNYRHLLFGSGKTVLEPVVRAALREVGFEVPDPEDYAGEWDVELRETGSSRTAIGEVEGPEGAVDVDKYRQLLDYFQAEVLEGRIHKGILIGNGYRLKELNAPERQNQFTEHALRGARQNGFCLLPTTELFKAVCAVLEAPENERLKIDIRNSILATVGVWAFSREVATPSEAVSSVTTSGDGQIQSVAGSGEINAKQ